jgi:hypothetical protein
MDQKTPNIKFAIKINNVNNQNSDLDALSENFVYFTKHTFTASKKFMSVSPLYQTSTNGKLNAQTSKLLLLYKPKDRDKSPIIFNAL